MCTWGALEQPHMPESDCLGAFLLLLSHSFLRNHIFLQVLQAAIILWKQNWTKECAKIAVTIISHIANGASVASLDLLPKPAAYKLAGSSGRSIVVWTMWLSCTAFLWTFLLSYLGFKIPWPATCSSLKGGTGFAWMVYASLVDSLQNSYPGRQWHTYSWDFQHWEGLDRRFDFLWILQQSLGWSCADCTPRV